MKISLFSLITLVIVSCSSNNKSLKTSQKTNWSKLEVDGSMNAASSQEIKDFNKNSPIYKLKNFFDSINFKCDTTRLNSLADYAYVDLRRNHFVGTQPHLYASLKPEKHSMSHNNMLIWGRGYYYTDYDRTSSRTHFRDLGIEFWEIDTTKIDQLEAMQKEWQEKYHPMPIYFHQSKDHLYVVYTRSMSFDGIAKRCLEVIKG